MTSSELLEFVHNITPKDIIPEYSKFHIIDLLSSINTIYLVANNSNIRLRLKSKSYRYLKCQGVLIYYDNKYKVLVLHLKSIN